MRADRLLSIIVLLQKHHRLTATDLSQRLGVTERTIYRDIEALSMAGVPVYTQTGPDGGCFLDEEYRSQFHWFTEAELQTLLFTGSTIPLSELGMQDAKENASLKLFALLSKSRQQYSEKMRQRLHFDATDWYGTHNEDLPSLPLLKDAIWRDVLIDIHYENWDGERKPYTLAPYSLVYKAYKWYLVAYNSQRDLMLTYRVSRISNITITKTPFERNSEFDIERYWQETSEKFQKKVPSYPVTLRVKPNVMTYFKTLFVGRYEILEKNTDWWILEVKFTVFEEARTSVLGLGTEVEVIQPKALHLAVIELAQAIIHKHNPT